MDEKSAYLLKIKSMNDDELRRAAISISNIPETILTDEITDIMVAVIAEMNDRNVTLNGDPRIKYGAMFITNNLRLFTDNPIRIKAMLNGWQSEFKKKEGYMVSDIEHTPHYEFSETYEQAEKVLEEIYTRDTIEFTNE